MTPNIMLDELREYIRGVIKDLPLKVRPREDDDDVIPETKAADVYKMSLPEYMEGAQFRYTPYVLIQLGPTKDGRRSQHTEFSERHVRIVFSVYDESGEEGASSLLNLIELVKVSLAQNPIVCGKYRLTANNRYVDREEPVEDIIETMVYTEVTWPYCMGEMAFTLDCPPIFKSKEFY